MARVGGKKAAGGRAVGSSAAFARAFAAEHLDGAVVTEKFGNASFSMNGKVFAFTRKDGLVLKLPPDALAAVIAERNAGLLVMGKRVMREWVLLPLDSPDGYAGELELMRAAMNYSLAAAIKS